MLSEKFGVNTMKRIFELLLSVFFVIAMTVSCSKQADQSTGDKAAGDKPANAALADSLSLALNEPWARLRYGDKSGFYENEFDYLTEDTTFDDYLKFPQISYASGDTLESLEVVSVERMGDSAVVNVTVHFKGPSGKETQLYDQIFTVYWYNNRWIKPTVSKYELEMKYQDLIHKADSAAAAEAGN